MKLVRPLLLSTAAATALAFVSPALSHQATRPVELSHKIEQFRGDPADGIKLVVALANSAEFDNALMRVTVEMLGDTVFSNQTVAETREEIGRGAAEFPIRSGPKSRAAIASPSCSKD